MSVKYTIIFIIMLIVTFVMGINIGKDMGINIGKDMDKPQEIGLKVSVIRVPAEEAIVYEGKNPPSDTSRLWHDTSNPNSGFGYTTMIYKNGKWTPLYPHITTVKDYK